ncbi:MAG TPA: extracellular solute-binding protein [Chloroflexota bacterium]|nr:extracellular solute-binding protein [Chloroflexota bacterium]
MKWQPSAPRLVRGAGVTRRQWMVPALALGGLGAIAACGGPPAAPAGGGGPQPAEQGKVLYWQESASEQAQQLWGTMAASFKEAYPKIEIEFDATPVPPGQSRDDKLLAALAAGTAWDVWQRDIPPSYQQPLVDQKAVLALDEYYASMPNLKRIHPWARNRSKLYGKTWGVPHEVEFIPIFYNKTAWQKGGIREAPKTWDQFIALNQTLKSAGLQPMNIVKGRTNPGHNFSIYLMGLIGKDGFEELLYRDRRWEGHEGVIRAAQTLVDFQKQGFIPLDCQTGTYSVATDFQNGTQAMWGSGTWEVAGLERRRRDTPGFEFDFFIPPQQDSRIKPTITGGLGGGFSIWSQSKQPQAAVTMVDFLMSPTAQKHWIEIMFQVAPVPFKPEDYTVPDVLAGALRTIASGQEMGYNVSVVVPAKFVDVYWDGLVEILNNQLTPRDWAARLQQEWDVARQENRTPKP